MPKAPFITSDVACGKVQLDWTEVQTLPSPVCLGVHATSLLSWMNTFTMCHLTNWTRANFLLLQKMYHKLHYAFSIFSLYLIYRLSLCPPPLCFLFHFHSSLPLPHFSASHWPVSVLWVKDCPSGLEPALGLCDFSSQSLISASRQLMFGEHSPPPEGKCYLWCVIPLVLTLTKC